MFEGGKDFIMYVNDSSLDVFFSDTDFPVTVDLGAAIVDAYEKSK